MQNGVNKHKISTNGTKNNNNSNNCDDDDIPLVYFQASNIDPSLCPFSNPDVSFSLHRGSCIHLAGRSGAGKTTLASRLAGLHDIDCPNNNLSTTPLQKQLGIKIDQCRWDVSIPKGERCGVLFQRTTLIDSLTLAGNLAIALRNRPPSKSNNDTNNNNDSKSATRTTLEEDIKNLLETVGLNYERDAHKRPTELSGGMARRASLALQIGQKKRVVVLDEPFAGLDLEAGLEVANELKRMRIRDGTAFILISHEPELARVVMGEDDGVNSDSNMDNCNGNSKGSSSKYDKEGRCFTITLRPPIITNDNEVTKQHQKPSLFGTTPLHRFIEDLTDYVFWSLPLIVLAFLACGIAIAMLSSDILRRIDVTAQVLTIVDKEVRPLIKSLTGSEANALTMMMVNFKIRAMLDAVVPKAKADLYAMGMAKLFVLEIGPLLTALLLCGRIGGSYAGRIATLRSTSQDDLLRTLGINPRRWTLLPACFAAAIASPLLTLIGTVVAVGCGSIVGPRGYGIGTRESYIEQVRKAVLPGLRLKFVEAWWPASDEVDGSVNIDTNEGTLSKWDTTCTWDESSHRYHSRVESIIEIVTYPPVFLLVKAMVFILIIMTIAEVSASKMIRRTLTSRHVPSVITSSVVVSGLLVIVADWGFSQLLLLRW